MLEEAIKKSPEKVHKLIQDSKTTVKLSDTNNKVKQEDKSNIALLQY